MRYTVWCGNRPIGETDLGFVRVFEDVRFGWFQPTSEGERVISAQTAVSTSTRAYVEHKRTSSNDSPAEVESQRTTLLADIAESYRHLESFELELRREDGSVVPTADIGFQDCRYLLEMAREVIERDSFEWDPEIDRFEEEAFAWEPDASGDDEELELTHATLDEMLDDTDDDSAFDPSKTPENERYQIHVRLLDSSAIP